MEYEAIIRLGFFFGAIIIMSLWELATPRRKLQLSKSYRWINNLSLVFVNTILIRILFPTAAVGFALYCNSNNIGLLNILNISFSIKVLIAVIILDLAIYLQHIIFHYVPFLWRFHKVHHADIDFDITTGFRFHPIEIILSLLFKFIVIAIIGPPFEAVIIFEIVLSTSAIFNHANIHINKKFDKLIRYIIITPDMHRIHHSSIPSETNSNFGFNISLWDRVFRTYKNESKYDQQIMQIGLKQYRSPKLTQSLWGMIKMPFERNN